MDNTIRRCGKNQMSLDQEVTGIATVNGNLEGREGGEVAPRKGVSVAQPVLADIIIDFIQKRNSILSMVCCTTGVELALECY